MRDATMSGDGFRETSERILNALVSEGLIELHDRCGADHTGMYENSKFACWFFSHNDLILVSLRATSAGSIVGTWSWRTNGGKRT